METLSGGNVQRTVLARELSREVRLLIMQNSCFGLDVAAAAEIRRQIVRSRNSGAAVLLISEDLDEVLELSDRVLVMAGGRITYETDVTALTATRSAGTWRKARARLSCMTAMLISGARVLRGDLKTCDLADC